MHRSVSFTTVIVGLSLAVTLAKTKPPPEPRSRLIETISNVECVGPNNQVRVITKKRQQEKTSLFSGFTIQETQVETLVKGVRDGEVWVKHVLPVRDGFHVYLSDGKDTAMIKAEECK